MSPEGGDFITNGYVLIKDKKVAEAARKRFWDKYKADAIKNIKKKTPDITHAEAAKAAEKQVEKEQDRKFPPAEAIWNPATEAEHVPLRPQYIEQGGGGATLVLTTGEAHVSMNASYYNEAMKLFPNAKPFLAKTGENQSIVFKVDGEMKYLAMPLLGKENYATTPDAEPLLKTAHHGTPHVLAPEPGFPHGRFRLDKIGTGEGAQAYGWGIYFAEEQRVGEIYQNQLRPDTYIKNLIIGGLPLYKNELLNFANLK
jgi:hypothetical protein